MSWSDLLRGGEELRYQPLNVFDAPGCCAEPDKISTSISCGWGRGHGNKSKKQMGKWLEIL